MAKEYGVYQDGTDIWVVTTTPLTTGSADQAQKWEEIDAMAVAAYLTSTTGNLWKVGRPDDRHGH